MSLSLTDCGTAVKKIVAPVDRVLRWAAMSYVPCPRCGAAGATRVNYTFWGSFYGPRLFHHVRCPRCRHAYNGKTGGSNLVPAILFIAIPAILIVGLLFYIYTVLQQRGFLS